MSDAAQASASRASVIASASGVLQSLATQSAALQSIIAQENATSATSQPPIYKLIGIILAVASGLFIGSSFVFKKKGLLASQKAGQAAGESHAYLKSPMWWTGMTLMIIGEICNFVAYSFADAILVTPMGALSVVICAILSSIFLKEQLTFFGKIGCLLCIIGSVIIAINGPKEAVAATIPEFQRLCLAPGFLVLASILVVVSLGLIFFVGPKYGKKNMLVYILICSLIGGLSVSLTSGLGASILTSIRGDNQFKHWFIYLLLALVVVTLLTEINFLNKALELFNTALVTPTYYVIFTFCTLVTSVVLNQGFKATPVEIITVVLGFLVICSGITLLQMSKIDPEELKLDRRSTMLFSAAKADIQPSEKDLDLEDPGVDSVRGFVGVAGSIHRAISARRSMTKRRTLGKNDSPMRYRGSHQYKNSDSEVLTTHGMQTFTRHQLFDKPMPEDAMDKVSQYSATSPRGAEFPKTDMPYSVEDFGAQRKRGQSIGFEEKVIEHRYPNQGDNRSVVHQTHVPRQQDGPLSVDIGEEAFANQATSPLWTTSFGSRPTSPMHANTAPVPMTRGLTELLQSQFSRSTPDLPNDDTKSTTPSTKSKQSMGLPKPKRKMRRKSGETGESDEERESLVSPRLPQDEDDEQRFAEMDDFARQVKVNR